MFTDTSVYFNAFTCVNLKYSAHLCCIINVSYMAKCGAQMHDKGTIKLVER